MAAPAPPEKVSPLLASAESGDLQELEAALQSGEDLETRNDRHATAMCALGWSAEGIYNFASCSRFALVCDALGSPAELPA